MNTDHLIETLDVEHEVVSETDKKATHSSSFDITQVIDEEVVISDVEENTNIVENDFEDAVDESDNVTVETDKKDPVKTDPAPKGTKDNPLRQEDPDAKNKQGAITRLMKPGVVMHVFNSFAGRTGKLINKNNPDFLKFDREDKEDIEILLTETVAEENWTGFPTKYLLLGMVALILVAKIFSWNKVPTAKIENTGTSESGDHDKKLQQLMQNFEKLEAQQKLIQEQNDLLRALLDKQISGKSIGQKTSNESGPPSKMYKGYDLSKISFTEKGAIIDPAKAGQQGYTDQGKKQGIPSKEEQDVKKQWHLYQKFINHEEEVEV